MRIHRLLHTCLAAGLIATLTACSNGRGSVGEPTAPVGETPQPQPQPPQPTPPQPQPPQPQPPQPTPPQPQPPQPSPAAALGGYWTGSALEGDQDDDDDEGDEQDGRRATAFIDSQGRSHLIVIDDREDDFVLYGDACCASSVTQKFDGARYLNTRDEKSDFAASSSNGRLTGSFEFRNDDYRFSLDMHASHASGATLQSLAGVYTRSTTFFGAPTSTLTITIDAAGVLTGSHSNGCVLNGSAMIPDPTRNIVRFTVSVDNCGSQLGSSRRWNGDYTGLGALLRNSPVSGASSEREDTLLLSLVGPTWLGLMSVGK